MREALTNAISLLVARLIAIATSRSRRDAHDERAEAGIHRDGDDMQQARPNTARRTCCRGSSGTPPECPPARSRRAGCGRRAPARGRAGRPRRTDRRRCAPGTPARSAARWAGRRSPPRLSGVGRSAMSWPFTTKSAKLCPAELRRRATAASARPARRSRLRLARDRDVDAVDRDRPSTTDHQHGAGEKNAVGQRREHAHRLAADLEVGLHRPRRRERSPGAAAAVPSSLQTISE